MRKNGFELGLIPHDILINLTWNLAILSKLALNSWVQVNHRFREAGATGNLEEARSSSEGEFPSATLETGCSNPPCVFTVVLPAPYPRGGG